ncbi:unnamed protein product [Arabis nemorensis]|uniref:CHCH domain-containing protein n=1 Tax=Arabis nemorensis TaxID=586526 RepID=A0A565AZ95_9BRAS|nr:unnamed protein product [Arabis nemorensis]
MGRRSSGGGSRSYSTGWSRSRSTPFLSKKSTPKSINIAKEQKAPPPAKDQKSPPIANNGRFFSSIADGFGFDMGHRFFEAIFGPRTIRQEIVIPEKVEVAALSTKDDNDKLKDYTESCSISYNVFQDCLKGNDLSKCHIFMDSLFECRKNSTSSFNF